jgi:hypothetical protein
MFLQALFTCKKDSSSEEFIFSDCLTPELQRLYNGVECTVNNVKYFIQARVVVHCLDTKALEKYFHVQCTASAAGCGLCRGIKGKHFKILKRVVFEGHRYLLPYTHYLRAKGQTQKCCLSDYYPNGEEIEIDEEQEIPEDEPEVEVPIENAKSISKKRKRVTTFTDEEIPEDLPDFDEKFIRHNTDEIWPRAVDLNLASDSNIYCCDMSITDSLIKFLHDNDKPYTWFHPSVRPVELRSHLFYKHCDFRPYKKHKRVSTETYITDGATAMETSKKSVDGIKGLCSFTKLPYFDIRTQCCYDGFHCIVNVVKNIIDNLKGNRINSGVIKHCQNDQVHPSLYVKNLSAGKAIWVLSERTQQRVDSWINAILIPKGMSGNFQVQNIFRQSGYLKGTSCILIATCLLDFMISATLLPKAYKLYFHMLSSDMCQLFSNTIRSEDIQSIFNKVLETVCTKEAMWPITECLMVYHQLIDLPMHIEFAGPLRGWWTLPSERAVGKMKSTVPIGGLNADKTAINRYMQMEASKLITSYDFNISDKEKFLKNQHYDGLVGKLWASVECENGRNKLKFTDKRIILGKKQLESKNLNWNDFENNCFVDILVRSILDRSTNYLDAINKSAYYRIYYFHIFHQKASNRPKNATKPPSLFTDFLMNLKTLLNTKNGYTCILRDNYPDKSIMELLELGYFLREDIPLVNSLIEGWKVRIFNDAFIFGTKFAGRGFYAREFYVGGAYNRTEPLNPLNDLKNNWINPIHYSSWCRYRKHENKVGIQDEIAIFGINYSSKTVYGQINSFLQLYLPLDGLLNGLVIASVTSRKSVNHYGVSYIYPENSWINNESFVLATDILAVPIGIVGFDTSGSIHSKQKPLEYQKIKKNNNNNNNNNNNKQRCHSKPFHIKQKLSKEDKGLYSTLLTSSLQYIVPLDLNREKENYMFDVNEDLEFNYRQVAFTQNDYFTTLGKMKN